MDDVLPGMDTKMLNLLLFITFCETSSILKASIVANVPSTVCNLNFNKLCQMFQLDVTGYNVL